MDRIIELTKPLGVATALFALMVPAGVTANPALSPALAMQSGRIDTLPIGQYECTLPGDAAGPAWHRVPESDFAILNASSYEVGGVRGVYLLRGNEVVFTRGPLQGTSMERSGQRILRERQADGTLGRMRCVLAG